MLIKGCWVLLILIGLLMGSAMAGYSFQPANAPNSIELNSTRNNTSAIDNESIQVAMQKLPLSFIENRGQVSNETKFMIKASHETIYFTPSGALFALSSKNNTSVVKMSFEGSTPGQVIGAELLPGTANFFLGNDSSKWVTDIPTYGSIKYQSLYPGIDLVFRGTEGNLKHELLLKPEADPAKIVLAYSGQDNLSLDKDGSILIRTAEGNLTDSAPICYQDINGSRVTVEGSYRRIDDKRIGFEVKNYNKSYSLVIDPALRYSTYLGGSKDDYAYGIAVDGIGSAYVTGSTSSTNFPIANAYQPSFAGRAPYYYSDAFVTKLSSAGNTLEYSTYLGGSGSEPGKGVGIAVDGSGSAYVTGSTSSTNFPIANAYQPVNAGSYDAFVTKLNSAGNTLEYSTYLGGSGSESGNGAGIAVDGSGSAYVTGYTTSTNFPTKNVYQATYAGNGDAFVTKLSSAGNTLDYSTYLGGSNSDCGNGIAVDGSGRAYVTGYTYSTNFPNANAYQGALAGPNDAFVTRLNSAGNTLDYSTYLGGSGYDPANGIAVDGSGSAYITGYTTSTNFPTANAYQGSLLGAQDAFVTKLSSAGNTLIYSTYLGGCSFDNAAVIAVDGCGNAYVAGQTGSINFPIKNAYQASHAGYIDAFITKLSSAGNTLIYSTYLGGCDSDTALGITVNGTGNAFVIGYTNSINFPTNAYQAANAGSNDAFIAIIGYAPPNTPSIPSGPTSGISGTSYTYSTSATDPDGDKVKYTFDWGDGTTSETAFVDSGTSASADHSWSTAGTYQVKAMATDSIGASSGWSNALTVAVNTPPSTPDRPSGPRSGHIRKVYTYSTSATDPDGDQIKYTFDWGDGTTSKTGLIDSGERAYASHRWSKPGIYRVKAMATDSEGVSSGWSKALTVTEEIAVARVAG